MFVLAHCDTVRAVADVEHALGWLDRFAHPAGPWLLPGEALRATQAHRGSALLGEALCSRLQPVLRRLGPRAVAVVLQVTRAFAAAAAAPEGSTWRQLPDPEDALVARLRELWQLTASFRDHDWITGRADLIATVVDDRDTAEHTLRVFELLRGPPSRYAGDGCLLAAVLRDPRGGADLVGVAFEDSAGLLHASYYARSEVTIDPRALAPDRSWDLYAWVPGQRGVQGARVKRSTWLPAVTGWVDHELEAGHKPTDVSIEVRPSLIPPVGAPRYDLFLAHNSADKDLAYEIAEEVRRRFLRGCPVHVFLDGDVLQPADEWWQEICAAIPASLVFVAMCRASHAGPVLRREVELAVDRNAQSGMPRYICPVMLDGPESALLPEQIRAWHVLNAVDTTPEHTGVQLFRLLERLAS
jgi:hypothetical protein